MLELALRGRLGLANKLLNKGHYEKSAAIAADAATAMAEIKGIDRRRVASVRLQQAAALVLAERYQEALDVLEPAIAVGFKTPGTPDGMPYALGLRICALENLGRLDEANVAAVQLLEKIRADADSHVERYAVRAAFHARAKVALANGDLALALKLLDHVLERCPAEALPGERIEALVEKGSVLENLDRPQEALSAYDEALSLHATYDRARRAKAQAKQRRASLIAPD